MNCKIAIVILNWNGAEMLRQFLPSVVRYSSEAVIFVADNGSTDTSCHVVRTEFPTVNLIELPENYGFAEGYNKALAQIEAEYVLLLNSDVEVTPNWLQPLLAYMDAHPDAAVCQPKVLSQREKTKFEYAGACGGYIDRYGYPFCRGRILGTVETDKGQYDAPRTIFWATGAALLIRAAIYTRVGGLDGRFFAHMEEIDLCWRLRSRGYGIVCVPQSAVYHVGAATLKKENPRKTWLNFRNNLLMLYKNLPENELKKVLRVRAWLDALAALQFLLKSNVTNARMVLKARKEFNRIKADFAPQRAENMENSKATTLPERVPYSILWRYYAKREKHFDQLPPIAP